MAECWYVIRSKPHKEDFLHQQLQSHKIESYCPRIRVQTVNPRARKTKPYFPGYIFVNLDKEKHNLSSLQWMPGATGLVSFGGEPSSIPRSLIQTIRNRVNTINFSGGERPNEIKPGENITIQEGPFSGYEAIFDTRLSGNDRVRVLLKMISNRLIPAEIATGQIRRKKSS